MVLAPIRMRAKPVVALGAVSTAAVAAVVQTDTTGISINTGLYEAGPWALLVGVVAVMFFGLFKGWVIVKLHYDTLLSRCLAAEAANVKLSERAALLTETNAVQARALEKNAAVGETVNRVMSAIQEARIAAGENT